MKVPPRSGKFYRKNEAEVMKRLGLDPTMNSGSGWIEKEDGQNENVIAQLKSTDAQSISLKLKDIHTLEYNALVAKKIPVFVVQFLHSNEVFVLARPLDLPNLAQYLETGEMPDLPDPVVSIEEHKTKKPKKQIKSGDRNSFFDELEKERENGRKRYKY